MITSLEQLLAGWHPNLVLAHGCFDLLHVGHVRHLAAAKAMGWALCVSITPDRFVNKGAGRPVVGEAERAEMVAALKCVDFVVINDHLTAAALIRKLKPAWYAKGAEYDGKITPQLKEEYDALTAVSGKLTFTVTEAAHTTDILEKLRCG